MSEAAEEADAVPALPPMKAAPSAAQRKAMMKDRGKMKMNRRSSCDLLAELPSPSASAAECRQSVPLTEQAGGHQGNFRRIDVHTICKLSTPEEVVSLETIAKDESLTNFVPKFHGEVELEDKKQYMVMEDLCYGFNESTMQFVDVKIGFHSFDVLLNSSKSRQKPREDLFSKLSVELGEDIYDQLTAEELESKTISKARFQGLKDHATLLDTLGFRIEAFMNDKGEVDRRTPCDKEEVISVLNNIFARAGPESRDRVIQSLNELRAAVISSKLMQTRRIVGTSLFIVFDEAHAKVSLVDFANWSERKEFQNHTLAPGMVPLAIDVDEDGVVTAIDNLIQYLADLSLRCASLT